MRKTSPTELAGSYGGGADLLDSCGSFLAFGVIDENMHGLFENMHEKSGALCSVLQPPPQFTVNLSDD